MVVRGDRLRLLASVSFRSGPVCSLIRGDQGGRAVAYGSEMSMRTRKQTRADSGHTLAINVPDVGPLPVSATVGLCVK